MIGVDLQPSSIGADGCGFPAPTMSLQQLAHAVAKFAKPADLSKSRAAAILRLQGAITREPFYSSGYGTMASETISATEGEVLIKTGAEGVLTAALPELGYGIALKIADGNSRASSVAMLALLDYLSVLSESQKIQLQAHITPQILNSRGSVVGDIHPAHAWLHE